jgi:hypothetical protein
MKTRHHQQSVACNDEKQRVRKPEKIATDVVEDDWELLWIDAQALDQSVDRFAKMPA